MSFGAFGLGVASLLDGQPGQIDGSPIGTAEWLTVTFDYAVRLNNFTLARMENGDDYAYSINGGALTQSTLAFNEVAANNVTSLSIFALGTAADRITGLDEFTLKGIEVAAVPVPAAGLIRVLVTPAEEARVLGAGLRFTRVDGSMSYLSTTDITIPAGASQADVPVAAGVLGVAGNMAAGIRFTLSPTPAAFLSASNLSPFVSGADAETAEAREMRFTAFIATLSRATPAALEYGAKTAVILDAAENVVERVRTAEVIEPDLTDPLAPDRIVRVYVHNRVGSTSGALVARAQQIIDGYREPDTGRRVPGYKAAGVPVIVSAALESPVAIRGTITPRPGFEGEDLATAAASVAFAYVEGLDIGEPLLEAELISRIMDIEGVQNIRLTTPTADVAGVPAVKLMPGTLAIAPPG